MLIYIIGLLTALGFIFFSLDDIFWDLTYIFKPHKPSREKTLTVKELDERPPKLLAIMVAAWHEDSVLEPVVDNMLASIQYPRSMYHIFLGVYPNDEKTKAAAATLELKYENVHMVVNGRPGPTCKADNINSIIARIRQFEAERGWAFAGVTVHDSEDVVHPYELKVTNFLLERYDCLQFPVFPLQRMPTARNFFRYMTSGTYADEFAENHYRVMRMRDDLSAVVPSAGTGFVLSRTILDTYVNAPIFPEDSLTEDYKLSLLFSKLGFKIHYVLENVCRLTDDNVLKREYIATRSIFPATFKTAVRQKTRWIYGITMQSAKFKELFARSRLSFAGRYSLYRDMKSKFSNLMVLPGYLVLIYAITSLFIDIPVMYPTFTFSWWLCVALTGMMLLRQALRAVAIKNVYGFKSVIISCLLPPLLPIRLVWGNIINMSATLCAWKKRLFGSGKGKVKKTVAWDKTDHEFISEQVLYGFRRNLGDVLLEKSYIHPATLQNYLRVSKDTGHRLGDVLMAHLAVTEEHLADALAHARNTPVVRTLASYKIELIRENDWQRYWDMYYCPLLKIDSSVIYAVTVFTPDAVCDTILSSGGKIVYTTKLEIILFLTRYQSNTINTLLGTVKNIALAGQINWEQAVIALDYQSTDAFILEHMGLAAKADSVLAAVPA